MISTNLPLTWLPLAEAIAKATLILAAAAVVSLTLRRASAALRHFVWTLAFCSALLIPLLTLALPKWQLPIVTVAAVPSAADLPDAGPGSERPAPARTPRREIAPASSTLASVDAPPASLEPRTSSWLRGVSWPQALGTIWLLGVLACLGRMAVGFAAVRWLSRRTQVIADASWLPMARALARDLGVDGRLTFLRSGRAAMPVAAGIFRPSVIMPADADDWPTARLRIVLLHELAHVKRRDCLTHLIAQVACALYWFNPLAWMAAKRARTERERACDDLVLASGTRGTEYADQLLDIARAMRPDRLAGLLDGASLAMAHRSQLEGRLIAILDPGLPRAAVSRARGLAAVVLCCCAVAPLGALQPWGETGNAADSVNAANAISGNAANTVNAANAVSGSAANAVNNLDNEGPGNGGGSRRSDANAVVIEILESAAPQLATQPAPAPRPAPAALAETVGQDLASVVAGAVVDGVVGGTSDAVGNALQDPKRAAPPEESRPKADPRTIAALTAALNDSDKDVRETAMHALVQLRDPSIFEPLLRALKDASPDVREQAAFGLGQMRDRRAVEPLVGALKDAQADVREQAAFALGQLREKSAVPGLVDALKDAAPDVREQAAFALGQLRDPAAVDGLAVAVRDANADVREQAVFALSQIRDARSVGPLISALKDATPDVRQQAAFALGQLRDRTAVEPLIIAIKDANADVREQVAFALGQLRDPRAIDALTAALKDASADVRRQAAFALGQLAR